MDISIVVADQGLIMGFGQMGIEEGIFENMSIGQDCTVCVHLVSWSPTGAKVVVRPEQLWQV